MRPTLSDPRLVVKYLALQSIERESGDPKHPELEPDPKATKGDRIGEERLVEHLGQSPLTEGGRDIPCRFRTYPVDFPGSGVFRVILDPTMRQMTLEDITGLRLTNEDLELF
jgi:hypothetical protein